MNYEGAKTEKSFRKIEGFKNELERPQRVNSLKRVSLVKDIEILKNYSSSTATNYSRVNSKNGDLKIQVVDLKTKIKDIVKKYKLREELLINENKKLKEENESVKRTLAKLLGNK